MKILLVEDEPLIQKALKFMLEKQGAQVIITSHGREAIKLIKENKFDRIITDLMLNDITGFDIIEETKSIFPSMDISKVFVVITAYSSSKIIENLSKYGVKVIHKPFENLSETIKLFLGPS